MAPRCLARALVALVAVLVAAHAASAIPMRETAPWTLLLCKLKDNDREPKSSAWFKEWFNNDSKEGSVTQFFRDVSNGMYTVYAAETYGWFKVPFDKAEVRRLALADHTLGDINDVDRKTALKTKELCTMFARFYFGIKLSSRAITFTNSQNIALFCRQRGILISTSYFMTSALTHEMCHSFHVGHSFSNRNVKVYPHADVGEYDDLYDLMSTSNAFSYWSQYGSTGPGLNGPHLDYLGWLPSNRVLFFNAAKSSFPQTLHLASLR
ncbi:unnamed protein product [Soboliphyme baturini]|uniref:Peptidase_M10 domain-containing protein n=1 Tax=Soboliphyme baturini TaxID=241478 RepID=A0A183ICT7_9BILA|nr:unnamed protein product [Soboliphyme baturini]